MKTSADPIPVVVVGGGIDPARRHAARRVSELVRPEHFAVANAIGAAIAQVGGEVDTVFSLERHDPRRGDRGGQGGGDVDEGGRGRRRARTRSGSSTSRRSRLAYLPATRLGSGSRRSATSTSMRVGAAAESVSAELDLRDLARRRGVPRHRRRRRPVRRQAAGRSRRSDATARCRWSRLDEVPDDDASSFPPR